MAFDGDLEAHQERHHANIQRAFDSVGELFQSKGEEFTDEDVRQMATERPPSIPSFPLLMVTAGLIKDAVDVLDLTIVGVIAAFFFSIVFAFIMFFWSLGKISGGWWKKGMIKWVLRRAGIVLILEIFPFIQIIPATTVFILLAHYHETKIAKLFNEGLEHLHKAGWRG